MATTTLNHVITSNYTERVSKPSIFARFFSWCEDQQENRILWIGVALTGHGCIITPLTIMTVLATGNNIVMFMTAIVAMAMALVTNLAAMPTKITIPVFVLSIAIDVVIMLTAAGMALGLS